MKLILCDKCGDIFNLNFHLKKCSCGSSYGKYLSDGLNAEVGGSSIMIGFANSSIKKALAQRIFINDGGIEFTAFVIPESARSIRRMEDNK